MSEEIKADPRVYVQGGGRRCAIVKSAWLDDWYVGFSPRNGEGASVEGTWADWVELANNILEADKATSRMPKQASQQIIAPDPVQRS
jgi:hypothetical protein